jgi:hypothetical protein
LFVADRRLRSQRPPRSLRLAKTPARSRHGSCFVPLCRECRWRVTPTHGRPCEGACPSSGSRGRLFNHAECLSLPNAPRSPAMRSPRRGRSDQGSIRRRLAPRNARKSIGGGFGWKKATRPLASTARPNAPSKKEPTSASCKMCRQVHRPGYRGLANTPALLVHSMAGRVRADRARHRGRSVGGFSLVLHTRAERVSYPEPCNSEKLCSHQPAP